MTKIVLTDTDLLPQTSLSALPEGVRLGLPAAGGGVLLPLIVTLNLHVFTHDAPEGPARFTVRFGLLPAVRTLVCHGARVTRDEISRVTPANSPCIHPLGLSLEEMELTDTKPALFPVPEIKLVDDLRQTKAKEWPGKGRTAAELGRRLRAAHERADAYPFSEWDRFGGHSDLRLAGRTGLFTKVKRDGWWWLADPLGNAFFSMGPDCVGVPIDGRVDGIEPFLDWLPDRFDPDYAAMFRTVTWPQGEPGRRPPLLFSYERANLRRAFGPRWLEKWNELMSRQRKNHGMNSLGNWSDPAVSQALGLPYVTQLPEFPSTAQLIFRDFPDVLSPEYARSAEVYARALEARRDDPLMIGVFLRNEPEWAFVDRLILADEVLFQSVPTICKEKLIASLAAQYGSIAALNSSWPTAFSSFDDLRTPIRKASASSPRADPNHMILGMRWAWIADADLVTGWRHFDVFSINGYATDPTEALDQVVNLGVDLPILAGEFHFGTLDRVARHPPGVGCHFFQCYDQFVLGRFDGENCNIGLFDVCSQPYPELMDAIRNCSAGVYDVMAGRRLTAEETARTIPMIAY